MKGDQDVLIEACPWYLNALIKRNKSAKSCLQKIAKLIYHNIPLLFAGNCSGIRRVEKGFFQFEQ